MGYGVFLMKRLGHEVIFENIRRGVGAHKVNERRERFGGVQSRCGRSAMPMQLKGMG